MTVYVLFGKEENDANRVSYSESTGKGGCGRSLDKYRETCEMRGDNRIEQE